MVITIEHQKTLWSDFWYGFINPGGKWKDISYLLKSGQFASTTDPKSLGEDPAKYGCEGIIFPGQWATKRELIDFCDSHGFSVEEMN